MMETRQLEEFIVREPSRSTTEPTRITTAESEDEVSRKKYKEIYKENMCVKYKSSKLCLLLNVDPGLLETGRAGE